MRLPDARESAHTPATALRNITVRWFGHSTFLLTSPRGVRLLFDPFITSNPSCPERERSVGGVDILLVTHGHGDHCEDAARIARESAAVVVASPELAGWLERQGAKHLRPMNIGGRQTISGIEIVMVAAVHSSSASDGAYLGPATGFVVRFEDGARIYFAGDTALFGDMKLIRDRYAPDVAFLPVGDRYTMGPEDAAIAADWLGVTTVIPMHYGTFPELTGTPAELREHLAASPIAIVELRPGETLG